MSSMLPGMGPGSLVSDHLEMVIPWTGWDFNVTNDVRRGAVLLRTKPRGGVVTAAGGDARTQDAAAVGQAAGTQLKGGMYSSRMPDGTPVVVFVGSLRVLTIDDLQVSHASHPRVLHVVMHSIQECFMSK